MNNFIDNMTPFNMFTDLILNELPKYLPKEYRQVLIEIAKPTFTTGSYNALTVRLPDANWGTAINLDAAYDMLNSGITLKELLTRLGEMIVRALSTDDMFSFDLSWIEDYDKVKERLFVRLSSADGIDTLRDMAPYKELGDMLITYHVMLDTDDDLEKTSMVTNQLLEKFGITPEQLDRDALENSVRILPSYFENLLTLLGYPVPEDSDCNDMFVLTNTQRVLGASALVYPNVLKDIAVQLGGGFIVLPSSIHELIVLPDHYDSENSYWNEMIEVVNESMVSPEDRLSYTAYHYDSETDVFEKLDDFLARV